MKSIKRFNQFILENADNVDNLKNAIDSLVGTDRWDFEEHTLSEKGFELDDQEGDPDDFAYYSLMSPVDNKNITHFVAKITVEDGKITKVSKNDHDIEEYFKNKK